MVCIWPRPLLYLYITNRFYCILMYMWPSHVSVKTLLCLSWRDTLPVTHLVLSKWPGVKPRQNRHHIARNHSVPILFNPFHQSVSPALRFLCQTISESLSSTSINPYYSIHTFPTCLNPASITRATYAQLSKKMLHG